ncbi:MAG: polysaccharide biosynthesis tyrosine autokinase [Actinobacteria bacterium]|nr:polysaccharide biosynthesis tyrosine autokinase [Actinomycetota bacterium]MBV8479813.1 polysaccharide biosynthesis tyrosine autokinase [Actinomycetota bacterium]
MSGEGYEIESSDVGLGHYLDIVRRRKWTALVVLAAAVVAGAAYGLTQPKRYEAQMEVVVGQGQGLVDPAYLGASVQPITATMAELAKSTIVAQQVIRRLDLKTTPPALLKKVSVAINPQTAVLDVSVKAATKRQAVAIASTLGTVFSRLVAQRFAATPQPNGNNRTAPLTATVFDPAHALPSAVSPRPKLDIAIAAVLGLVLGLVAAFARNYFDRRLRDRDSVEKAFGVPVIAQIPFDHSRSSRSRGRVEWGDFGEMVEAFRGLRANLSYLSVRSPLRTILVTSATPGQGKTTVAANLGLAMARQGAATAVVEADLRRPRLDEAYSVVHSSSGLTGLLVGHAGLEDALVDVGPPGGQALAGRLALLPSGALPPNPSELLSSFQMRDALDQLKQSFDYVIVDSSPLMLVADPLEVARMVDGVVVVVRKDDASRDEAREVRAVVERLGVHLLGVVLTDTEHLGASYGHYGEAPGETPPRRTRRRLRHAAVQHEEA